MEIETSGWRDLDDRLATSSHTKAETDCLVEHVADRLVSHFGVDTVECWIGKDGARRHTIREIAAAAVAHLGPVLDLVPPGAITSLAEEEAIGTDMPPPWDDHWRSQTRTASWRS